MVCVCLTCGHILGSLVTCPIKPFFQRNTIYNNIFLEYSTKSFPTKSDDSVNGTWVQSLTSNGNNYHGTKELDIVLITPREHITPVQPTESAQCVWGTVTSIIALVKNNNLSGYLSIVSGCTCYLKGTPPLNLLFS